MTKRNEVIIIIRETLRNTSVFKSLTRPFELRSVDGRVIGILLYFA